jgi:hypothetical protein
MKHKGWARGLGLGALIWERGLADALYRGGPGRFTGWREFSLYRAAVRAEPLTVSFGLSGLGSALLDDISVEALQPLAVRPVAQPPAGASPVR